MAGRLSAENACGKQYANGKCYLNEGRAGFQNWTISKRRLDAKIAASGAEQALHEIEAELAITSEGERNERLYKAAFRLGTMAARGWLAEAEIRNAVHRGCQANGLIKDDGRPAFQRTLDSGLADGLKVPHEDLRDREQYAGHEERGGNTKDSEESRRLRKERSPGSWDEPDSSILDDRRGTLPDFPAGVLSDSCEQWLARAAHGAGVTHGHVAVPLLATCASLIGTARRIRPSRSWSEPCTLWTAIVGFSGTGKTPGISVTKRALSLIESIRKDKIAELQRRHDTKSQTAKAAAKAWKDQVEEAVRANLPPPEMPVAAMDPGVFVTPRLYVSEATIERHAVLLQARPRGMLLMSDELASLFLNMGRYSNGSDKEFWLETWNGHHYVVERMGRPPVMIDHLLIGMTSGFQPDKLARSFEGDSDGMHARVLFAWPEEPAFHSLTDDVTEIEPELLNALCRIVDLPAGEDDVFAPRDVRLSADARTQFEDFRYFQHRGKDALDGREREWWAKGPSQVLRLAGTLCYLDWAMEGGPEPQAVEARFIEAAVRLWRDYFWPHSRAAVRQIGLTDHHAEARRVLRWLKAGNHQKVSREEVRREALTPRLDADEVQTIIDGLVRAGWLREVTAKAEGPGRPALRWEVNPRLSSIR